MKTKYIAVVLIAIVIAVGSFMFGSNSAPKAGSIDSPTTFGILGTTQIKIGDGCGSGFKFNTASCLGTGLTKVIANTCSLISASYSVIASSSVAMDCAVTNAAPGDLVFGMLATSTASTAGPGWEIVGASASSTAGFVTFRVTNGTGATAIIPASLASTTQYFIFN